MKKIFVIAAAVAAMFSGASCQKEQPIGGGMFSKEAEVSFTVNVPSQVATKGIADAENVDIVYFQIWNTPADPTNEPAKKLYPTTGDCASATVSRNAQTQQMEATINVTLVKDQTYTFIFWAQDKEFTGYTTTDLRNVSVDYSKFGANNDACDAFYAYEQIEVKGAIEKTITLTRPFAQLNFGASAMKCDLGKVNLGATTVTVSKLSTVFNTETGLGDGTKVAEKVEFKASGLASSAESLVTETGSYYWVKMDYMLMQEAQDNVTVEASFDVGIPGIEKPVTHKLTEVPLKKNHRTNIVGDLFTTNAKLTIIVDERFVDEEGNLNPDLTPADVLMNTFAKGGEFTLFEDMTFDEFIEVADDKAVTLNLNGHAINGVGIISYGDLTINGPGKVNAKDCAVWARGDYGATVTINGGHFVTAPESGSCETIYASGNGKVVINGGKFENKVIDNNNFAEPCYAVLNLHGNGATGCDIIVYGGEYVNFNPADNVSENPKKNFVAEGYESVETAAGSNVWVVRKIEE